ncbi:hypothetical protein B0H16DRAFT_1473375 [Mycena metata]|uniref:Uncharacterized protein n=1 Tax=Mycena metata TaxID=1033252 RepID=A0AAD7HL91_9AGAR|nr:hypothetical protein B0H16DRAFT_1473375 [Mycena metata]
MELMAGAAEDNGQGVQNIIGWSCARCLTQVQQPAGLYHVRVNGTIFNGATQLTTTSARSNNLMDPNYSPLRVVAPVGGDLISQQTLGDSDSFLPGSFSLTDVAFVDIDSSSEHKYGHLEIYMNGGRGRATHLAAAPLILRAVEVHLRDAEYADDAPKRTQECQEERKKRKAPEPVHYVELSLPGNRYSSVQEVSRQWRTVEDKGQIAISFFSKRKLNRRPIASFSDLSEAALHVAFFLASFSFSYHWLSDLSSGYFTLTSTPIADRLNLVAKSKVLRELEERQSLDQIWTVEFARGNIKLQNLPIPISRGIFEEGIICAGDDKVSLQFALKTPIVAPVLWDNDPPASCAVDFQTRARKSWQAVFKRSQSAAVL